MSVYHMRLVHDLICNLGFELKEICDINSIVTQNGEVRWKAITDRVRYEELGLYSLCTSSFR